MLARQIRTERHIYGREEAPHFVNKFSSGDPNYRDSTFFPHFVQNNWLNGFDQEKFNDGGKYYRSSAVDPTNQEKLTLEKQFSSTGQTAASIKILCQKAWRATGGSYFGDGSDGALTISSNTTEAPIDSTASGTQGSTSLTATNASFAAGQVIMVIQMQGTNAGKWEKNKILSYTAGTITTETPLSYTYASSGNDKAQVRVLKQYTNVTINSGITYTAKAWDGSVGGILAFLANGTVTVTGTITGTEKGFRGSTTHSEANGADYQGEGTGGNPTASQSANGNGGGGGENETTGAPARAGGGGGGHAAAGSNGQGTGGSSGGTGGSAVGQGNLNTSMFMGGGGGSAEKVLDPSYANGGNGGGIIAILGKTFTMSGAITSHGGAGGSASSSGIGGGGGAGGSVLIKCQTATLGTNLVTMTGGAAGNGGGNADGGAGAVGRGHIDYLTSFSGTFSGIDSLQDGTLTDSSIDSAFTFMVGASDGKVYSWNGSSTYTELFDARKLEWYDTGDDNYVLCGDVGADTERKGAQGFQLSANGAASKIKAVSIYMKKDSLAQGLTLRIETNSGGVPSGTLANANATATVNNADLPTTNSWVTFTFATSFSLSASTLYHIVVQNSNFASETGTMQWRSDNSSPSYSNGSMSSKEGGAGWAADTAYDNMFRILGEETTVNCMLITDVGGTQKLYIGTGDPEVAVNGNARLYSYDGTNFALVKTFNTTNESAVLSLAEYGTTTPKVYLGLGSKAKIYSTTDFSTFTLSKTITVPSNPGYVFSMIEYNGRLYAGGGYPQQMLDNNNQYLGFLYSYDEFQWTKVGEFEHTVVKCLETFDNLLFIGTIKKRFYVYNTASVDKLLEFPHDLQMTSMIKWEDKLAIATAPTPGSSVSGHEGVYLFDRNGFHNAFNVSSRSWYSIGVFNNNLMGGNDDGYVYQTSSNTYQASGTLQMSYFEASLPSIDKKWRSLILQYEALPTGCTILAEYKTDESDASWTSIGTASTVGSTSAEFTFSSSFYSKKLSIRLTLATSSAANTPTLKIVDVKYVLYPDFKYLWKMTLACPDNLVWLDRTRPISTTTAASISAGATSLVLADGTGFPTKGRAVLVDGSTEDEFTWTGRSGNTLTGIPSTGALALSAHSSTGYIVKMTGATMHHTILEMKETKALNTFVDIDGTSYTVLFHGYQEDQFVVNQSGGLENHVPITLLEV